MHKGDKRGLRYTAHLQRSISHPLGETCEQSGNPSACSADPQPEATNKISKIPVFLIFAWLLVRIRTRGSVPLTNRSGSCYFRPWPLRCQQKTILFLSFSASYLLKVHLHYFYKLQNKMNQGFSYYFCLTIEGSRSGARAGSVPLTNGPVSHFITLVFFINKEFKFCGHRCTQSPLFPQKN